MHTPFQKLFFVLIFAQSAMVVTAQSFFLNGSAIQITDTCWQLTPDLLEQTGSIWNAEKVSLNESFEVLMSMYFGCKDADGADGIVFGLQPLNTSIGVAGEGIGFQGVAPSLGIEFDTYQNNNLNDPAYDHIAIVRNGDMNHASANTLAGPVQARPANPNIEDCQWHTLRVTWDAAKKQLDIWFDCELRLSWNGDLVNDIFGGDPEVFWGFTSATGGLSNLHQVCFSYTTFLDGFEDVVICPGGQFQMQLSGGQRYHWEPAYGLSNPDIANPVASPDTTTTYFVEVLDDCNIPFYDTITIFVDGDTVFFDLGPDTTACENSGYLLDATSFGTDTVTYQWNTGETTPTLAPSTSGIYSVTVTIDQYCVADDRVHVEVVPVPRLPVWQPRLACLGDTVVLDGTSPGNPEYRWQDGPTGPVRAITEPGVYVLSAANRCGSDHAVAEIGFEDCRQVYFPNAFSPNDDGFNDAFYPQDNGDVVEVRSLRIFDRWGELVFEAAPMPANDPARGWHGQWRGRPAPPGTYVWMAEVRFRDGYETTISGTVTLFR